MLLRFLLSFCLILSVFHIPAVSAVAGSALELPKPGVMIDVSRAFEPVLMKGLKVHPTDPLLFDFIMDSGNSRLKIDGEDFKAQREVLIKYFLSALTIPERDLWVNLSPYEKDRMIASNLGQTQMGQDMLAQDYLLKQLTASLIYPEKGLGKEFWDKVYAQAQGTLGTKDIPINMFNKVWIVADKADVYEGHESVYVTKAHLRVMLEADYLATEKFQRHPDQRLNLEVPQGENPTRSLLREIVLPAIEKEINEGQNFAPLRQMYYSMILASWYKMRLKEGLISQAYGNHSKVNVGVNADDPDHNEKIFSQYVQAYKKGVFNFIKESPVADGARIPRKYFSGGLSINSAMVIRVGANNLVATGDLIRSTVRLSPKSGVSAENDKAMTAMNVLVLYNLRYKKSTVNFPYKDPRPFVERLTREGHHVFLASNMRQVFEHVGHQRMDVIMSFHHFFSAQLIKKIAQQSGAQQIINVGGNSKFENVFKQVHDAEAFKEGRGPRRYPADKVVQLSSPLKNVPDVLVVSRYNARFQEPFIDALLPRFRVWRAPSTEMARNFLKEHPQVQLVVAFGFKPEVIQSIEAVSSKVLSVEVGAYSDAGRFIERVKQLLRDSAMTAPGGIDFDAGKLQMRVDTKQLEIVGPDPRILAQVYDRKFKGFEFKIEQSVFVADPKGFLGS